MNFCLTLLSLLAVATSCVFAATVLPRGSDQRSNVVSNLLLTKVNQDLIVTFPSQLPLGAVPTPGMENIPFEYPSLPGESVNGNEAIAEDGARARRAIPILGRGLTGRGLGMNRSYFTQRTRNTPLGLTQTTYGRSYDGFNGFNGFNTFNAVNPLFSYTSPLPFMPAAFVLY